MSYMQTPLCSDILHAYCSGVDATRALCWFAIIIRVHIPGVYSNTVSVGIRRLVLYVDDDTVN